MNTASTARRVEFQVGSGDAGTRLDRFLVARLPDLSRARLQSLVEEGLVRVAGSSRKIAYRLKSGELVTVTIPPPAPLELMPEAIPLAIVYEDDHLLVVDKPAGMVVHPGAGQRSGTLVHALLAHTPSIAGVGGAGRPGIVHRLDKGTSGLLVAAKTAEAYRSLTRQLVARTVSRRYLALLYGEMRTAEGIIEAPIGRHPRDRIRMAVRPEGKGKAAVTHFTVRERFRGFTLIEARLGTGRTHQIRVHMAEAGHPVVGDETYRSRSQPLPDDSLLRLIERLQGHALHAIQLSFIHPVTGTLATFHALLPERIERLLSHFRIVSTQRSAVGCQREAER